MSPLEMVEKKLIDQLHEFTGKDKNKIIEAQDLVATGIIDSLVTVNMILACEDEFDVTIYPDEARELISVRLIAAHLVNEMARA